jgi:hypothetical protein
MSIFKGSFHESIKGQLSIRQAAMTNRTPQNLSYLNSRNAWIRLSSSVNVYNGPIPASPTDLQDEKNYNNGLANKYILQGGILNNEQPRAGIGNFSNAYSNVGSDGTPYRLGIRPMPGITGVDIKNKGAYGSLRSATVNFQCWDIKQLEDLELLYMRPGYTLLLEWGWSPYLDNNGNYTTTVDYTDIINTEWTKEDLFKRQYARATNGKYKNEAGTDVTITGYQGNADSMFGFVKNYSWKARMDGGYDCTTELVSLGEVIESLKVNYSPLNSSTAENGLISANVGKTIDDTDQLKQEYTKNILAGIFYELWEIGKTAGDTTGSDEEGHSMELTDNVYKDTYNLFRVTINISGGDKEASGTGEIGKSDEQIYITLETLCNILNNYVLLRDKKSSTQNGGKSRPFAPLSVKESEQEIQAIKDNNTSHLETDRETNRSTNTGRIGQDLGNFIGNTINQIENLVSEGLNAFSQFANQIDKNSEYLLALAHPLQVSIDPTVCLIKNKLWADGIKIEIAAPPSGSDPNDPNASSIVTFPHNLSDPLGFVKTLIDNSFNVSYTDSDASKAIISKFITDYLQGPNGENTGAQLKDNVREVSKIYKTLYSTHPIGTPTKLTEWGLENSKKTVQGKTIAIISPFTNTFYDLLDHRDSLNLNGDAIDKALGGEDNRTEIADSDPEQEAKDKIEEEKEKLEEAAEDGAEGFKFLNNLDKHYFTYDDYNTELGIIGNIYVNVNMLYNLCVSGDLAAQDKKEKQEIALYDFVKNILKKVSAATGDINNLDLFVNPETGVVQIIDINYVDRKNQTEAYKNAYQLEVHNLNSIVRSYSLESKIFQEQASIVAIGAQVGGGALGVDTTTLVAFNRSIRDRIIPIKDAPTSTPTDEDPALQLDKLTKSLSFLYTYAGDLKSGYFTDGSFDVDKTGQYAGALKDLIAFFQTLGKTKTKNRAILPTVLSVDIDGIGGMVIGNLFKINSDILPRGYKTGDDGGVGPKLGYVLTGIGHSLKGNDWITKLEAQTIILDEPTGITIPFGNLTVTDESTGETKVVVNTNAQGSIVPPIGSGNSNAILQATNAVFGGGNGQSGKCARYVYNIARDYVAALRGKSTKGLTEVAGGNANQKAYRDRLKALGYTEIHLGTISRSELTNLVNNDNQWSPGDIINYSDTSNSKKSQALYGHTQIYTGGVQKNSNKVKFASSVPANYGSNTNTGRLVYKGDGPWDVYVFRAPTA